MPNQTTPPKSPTPSTTEPLALLLERLAAAGMLHTLLERGVIPVTVLEQRDIFFHWDMLVRTGTECTKAVYETAEHFKCGRSTVFRALRKMR